MITDRHFPPDRRVEKEAAALKRAGHAVFLLALGHADFITDLEIESGALHVRYVPELRHLNRLRNSYEFQRTLRNRHWQDHIRRFVSDFRIDVVHVHDLPLLATALDAARPIHLPVVADLRAHYPTLVELRRARVSPFLAPLLAPPRRWVGYEARALAEAVHTLVTSDEARQHLIESHPLWPDLITTILDAEEVERFASPDGEAREQRLGGDRLSIVAVGGHGDQGGLDTALLALPRVAERLPHAGLVVVGADRREASRLKAVARRAGVSERLALEDALPAEQLRAGMIAVLPYARNVHTETVLPHELFVYMLLAVPVIASDCAPLRRIVEESGCGLVFPAGDADALAAQIVRLGEDAALRRTYGQAGRVATEAKYNWEAEARKLTAVYERINRERPLQPPGLIAD